MRVSYGFSAGILWDDGCCYFSNLDFNGLFKMNMENGEVKFLMFFPDEKKQQGYLHKKCMRYNDAILFIPESAEHIHIYKPESGQMDVVKCERFEKKDVIFSEPVLRDNYLFIFPATFGQPIIKICLDDYSCVMNWEFADWCKRKIHTEEDIIFGRVVQRDDYVWLAVHGSDQIVRVSLDSGDGFSLYSLGNSDISLFALFESKTGFWLVQKEAGTILHWNEKSNRLEKYLIEEEKIEEGRPFNYILETNFGVYAIPAYARNIQKLILEDKKFHKVAEIPDDLEKRESKIAFFGIQHRGNELWMFPYGFYQMLVFDMSMDQLRTFKMKDEKLFWAREPYLSIYLEGYRDSHVIFDEICDSDVVYVGGQVIRVSDFRNEFPDWYKTWNLYANENNDEYILISDYKYGISATLNAFYKIEFDKAKADFLCELSEDNSGGIYHPPIRLGSRMIFAPCRSKNWAYLDLKTKDWTYVDIPKKFYKHSNDVFIRSWKSVKDSLIYLPGESGIFAKLDYKNGEITYHDCLNKLTADKKTKLHISGMSTYKSSVLIAFSESNELYEINVEDMNIVKVHKVGHDIRGFKSIFAIPKTDWIFFIENTDSSDPCDMRTVYKWNISTGDLWKLDNLPVNPCGKNEKDLLAGFLYHSGYLYVTPQRGDCFVRINVENNSAERIKIDVGHNLMERKNIFYKRWGDDMAFPMFTYNGYMNTFTATLPYDFSIAEIDFENRRILNQRKWRINGIKKLLKQNLANMVNGICYENDFYLLRDFIGDLK